MRHDVLEVAGHMMPQEYEKLAVLHLPEQATKTGHVIGAWELGAECPSFQGNQISYDGNRDRNMVSTA